MKRNLPTPLHRHRAPGGVPPPRPVVVRAAPAVQDAPARLARIWAILEQLRQPRDGDRQDGAE